MKNTQQANPSKAEDSSTWPDWNAQYGVGTDSSEVEGGEAEQFSFNESHKAGKEAERERRENRDSSS
jgi:hypothetical protein